MIKIYFRAFVEGEVAQVSVVPVSVDLGVGNVL